MSNIKANAISTQQLFRGKEKKKKIKKMDIFGHYYYQQNEGIVEYLDCTDKV